MPLLLKCLKRERHREYSLTGDPVIFPVLSGRDAAAVPSAGWRRIRSSLDNLRHLFGQSEISVRTCPPSSGGYSGTVHQTTRTYASHRQRSIWRLHRLGLLFPILSRAHYLCSAKESAAGHRITLLLADRPAGGQFRGRTGTFLDGPESFRTSRRNSKPHLVVWFRPGLLPIGRRIFQKVILYTPRLLGFSRRDPRQGEGIPEWGIRSSPGTPAAHGPDSASPAVIHLPSPSGVAGGPEPGGDLSRLSLGSGAVSDRALTRRTEPSRWTLEEDADLLERHLQQDPTSSFPTQLRQDGPWSVSAGADYLDRGRRSVSGSPSAAVIRQLRLMTGPTPPGQRLATSPPAGAPFPALQERQRRTAELPPDSEYLLWRIVQGGQFRGGTGPLDGLETTMQPGNQRYFPPGRRWIWTWGLLYLPAGKSP